MGLDPASEFGVYASPPSNMVFKPLFGSWERDTLRLKAALGRRPESWEDGSGGRCEDAKAEDRLGEEAVATVEWPREGRGRPSERR